ncbi:anti-sigma factor [Nocardioides bruguierae]|uniref:Regulator of SigK n=1 Tax=Nocardioides bruguierae TaxID=2945102 RepID=A0A9X2D6V0_9ACTN|nr:anti-sigma factor [Nocardioides bruguierae]MCM0620268.1 anti-sigma factor [Nocardioides bruguierae]
MNDVHALSGAYAVDALDDVERARFERHLAECGDCRGEVDSLREAGALLAATAEEVTPPGALRERLLAEVGTVRPLPPVVASAPRATLPTPSVAAHRPPRVRTFVAAAAAAVITLGAATTLAITRPWDDAPAPSLVASPTDRVLAATDAERYVQKFEDGSKAVVVRSKDLNQAVIITSGMSEAPDGSVYELWLDHDGEMVAAGFMPDGPDNEVLLSGDAATATGLGISVEPEGGSPEPTLEGAVIIPFENA